MDLRLRHGNNKSKQPSQHECNLKKIPSIFHVHFAVQLSEISNILQGLAALLHIRLPSAISHQITIRDQYCISEFWVGIVSRNAMGDLSPLCIT